MAAKNRHPAEAVLREVGLAQLQSRPHMGQWWPALQGRRWSVLLQRVVARRALWHRERLRQLAGRATRCCGVRHTMRGGGGAGDDRTHGCAVRRCLEHARQGVAAESGARV